MTPYRTPVTQEERRNAVCDIWVVPFTVDYEAAIKAWHDLSYLQLKTVEDEITYIVDAALGGVDAAMVGGGR